VKTSQNRDSTYGVTEFSEGNFLKDVLLRKGWLKAGFSDLSTYDKVNHVFSRRVGALVNSTAQDVWRAPLLDEPCLFDLVTAPQIRKIVRMASPYFDLNQQNAVISSRQHGQDRWHRDIPYQQWIPGGGGLAAINILFMFANDVGRFPALEIINGSHVDLPFPCDDSIDYLSESIFLEPYEFLVMNSFLFHRAPLNLPSGIALVNQVFAPKIFSQQVDFLAVSNLMKIHKNLDRVEDCESTAIASYLGLDRKRL